LETMRNVKKVELSESIEHKNFKHWLSCFDRDLKKAWKKKSGQDPVQAELNDPLTDEILDLNCVKERLSRIFQIFQQELSSELEPTLLLVVLSWEVQRPVLCSYEQPVRRLHISIYPECFRTHRSR